MAPVSFSTAWDDTNAIVRREAALLVPVALALIVLPGVVLDRVRPSAAVMAKGAAAGAFEPALLANPLNLLVTLFASLVLSLLALRPGISVAEAMREAGGRFPVAVGSSLLLGIGFALVAAPALPIVLGGEGAVQRLNPAFALLLLLYLVAIALGLVFAMVRLLLLNTVAVGERRGVFATIARSWEMTRGLFWRLLGFVLLFVAASVIAAVAVVTAGGTVLLALGRLLGDEALGRLLLDLLRGLANAAFLTWFYVMLANLYRQLAGRSAGSKSGI
ncbi:hypothetical protein [Sphingomonas profundi]|uniref:hypothetical protein n=1 Tax=Alterirhizorhabdus profundi TaxID=2681549 RepID=UPI0012E93494|nr:hypothetical protein [Sphingomonas profundi]